MRLIDADDLKKRLENPPYTIYNGEMFAEWFDECFKSQPIIEAQPVMHGRWILYGKVGQYREYICSVCSTVVSCKSAFCPDCGARMDGGAK